MKSLMKVLMKFKMLKCQIKYKHYQSNVIKHSGKTLICNISYSGGLYTKLQISKVTYVSNCDNMKHNSTLQIFFYSQNHPT